MLKKECNNIIKKLITTTQFTNNNDNNFKSIIEIISGTARGADKLGERFAKEYNLRIKKFPANWDLYGKKAGYLRNIQMAEYAKNNSDLGVLIAFWDGNSKGTKHMIDIAKKHELLLFIVKY